MAVKTERERDSSTENQLNILSLYMVADNTINYLHKFIMLCRKLDRILIHNLHVPVVTAVLLFL